MLDPSLEHNYEINSHNLNFKIIKFENLLEDQPQDIIAFNHTIDYYTIIFITKDIGRHSIDYNDYYYSKGTILFIRKHQVQKFYNNKSTKGYLLFFKEEFLNSYLSELEVKKTIQAFNELLTSPKTQLNDKQYEEIYSVVTRIELESSVNFDNYSDKIIRSLVHILITMIYRSKSEGYDKVQLSKYLSEFIKFQNILEEEYSTSRNVAFYSKKLGFSSKKLNTIVKYIANKPAKQFIDEVVIIKIKKFLLQSSLSIKEIAFKVGFQDPANLYKYFKKRTKYTPEAYRNKYKV